MRRADVVVGSLCRLRRYAGYGKDMFPACLRRMVGVSGLLPHAAASSARESQKQENLNRGRDELSVMWGAGRSGPEILHELRNASGCRGPADGAWCALGCTDRHADARRRRPGCVGATGASVTDANITSSGGTVPDDPACPDGSAGTDHANGSDEPGGVRHYNGLCRDGRRLDSQCRRS